MIIAAQPAVAAVPEYFKHNGNNYDILFKSDPGHTGRQHMVLRRRMQGDAVGALYFCKTGTAIQSGTVTYSVSRTSPQAACRMIDTLTALIMMSDEVAP
jgi:hypothetical protein